MLTAARRLGYLPEGTTEAPARLLRFTFLLPAGTNHFMEALKQQIEAQAAERPDLEVRVEPMEGFNPESLDRRLDGVASGTHGLGLVALDHTLVREAIRRLAQRGVKVVTLASDVQNVPSVA